MDLPAGSQSYGSGERCLVFVPGFLAVPASYRSLLAPVAAIGVRVVVPLLTRPGPAALLGRVSPEKEAARLAPMVAGLRCPAGRCGSAATPVADSSPGWRRHRWTRMAFCSWTQCLVEGLRGPLPTRCHHAGSGVRWSWLA